MISPHFAFVYAHEYSWLVLFVIWSRRIFERVVVTKTMPLANLTGMTDEERAVLERWYATRTHTD